MAAQKRRILEAAITCIAETGVERTSIDDIRKAAGLSGGTIYLHYSNKEDLIVAAIREFTHLDFDPPQTLSEFQSILNTIPIKTRLTREQVVLANLRLSAESLPPSPLNTDVSQVISRSLEKLTGIFAGLERNGETSLPVSPARMARLVYAVEYGIGWLNLIMGIPFDPTMKEISETLDFLLTGRPLRDDGADDADADKDGIAAVANRAR
jgi:AcrR family transcriptional regulator